MIIKTREEYKNENINLKEEIKELESQIRHLEWKLSNKKFYEDIERQENELQIAELEAENEELRKCDGNLAKQEKFDYEVTIINLKNRNHELQKTNEKLNKDVARIKSYLEKEKNHNISYKEKYSKYINTERVGSLNWYKEQYHNKKQENKKLEKELKTLKKTIKILNE